MDGGIIFLGRYSSLGKNVLDPCIQLGVSEQLVPVPPSCDWARGGVHPGEGPDPERQRTTKSQIPGFKLLLFEVLIEKDTHGLSHERTS